MQTVEVSSTLQLQESIGLALKTKVLMLCCMEKMTRTQFLNKNISQTHCVRMEINSRCPASNKHFSQPCISPDPQSLPAIAKSQFHFQGILKFFVYFTDHLFFFFFFSFSDYPKQNFEMKRWSASKLSVPETTNSNLLLYLCLGNGDCCCQKCPRQPAVLLSLTFRTAKISSNAE